MNENPKQMTLAELQRLHKAGDVQAIVDAQKAGRLDALMTGDALTRKTDDR